MNNNAKIEEKKFLIFPLYAQTQTRNHFTYTILDERIL